jgi:hypothetical protein
MSDHQFYLVLSSIYFAASPLAPVSNFVIGLLGLFSLAFIIIEYAKHP